MNCFFRDYHEALFKCNKPYQYVGGEFLSYNKDFDSAKVRFAFAFPDKYEIGISNLGVRVLYGLVNEHKDYMADRVYAPEPDFQPKELYGLESKRKIREFDAVGFSLQYEMAYPTVLKMLEMNSPKSQLDKLYINLSDMISNFGELDDVEFDKNDLEQLKVIKTTRILLNNEIYSHSFTQI